MKKWFMVTLVGRDRPGIVARVTAALFKGQCNLGEASMTRLGGNFTIMLMVNYDGVEESLEHLIQEVCEAQELRFHVDPIVGELHHHVVPDVRISVHGADRAGIVAEVTGALAEAGLNILDLESDIGGTEENPIYIMHVEGVATKGIEALKKTLETLTSEKNIDTHLTPVDTFIG